MPCVSSHYPPRHGVCASSFEQNVEALVVKGTSIVEIEEKLHLRRYDGDEAFTKSLAYKLWCVLLSFRESLLTIFYARTVQ
jgi:hypothetical protein